MNVGDRVYKTRGYKFPGVVVAKFATLNGAERYVVECTATDCAGCLHIFGSDQITKESEGAE